MEERLTMTVLLWRNHDISIWLRHNCQHTVGGLTAICYTCKSWEEHMAVVDHIRMRAEVFQEDDQYVAVCPELNVSSFGDSSSEAVRSLQEAVSLFLEECHRLGTLKAVLEEAGFSHTATPTHQWLPPKPVGTELLSVSVAHA